MNFDIVQFLSIQNLDPTRNTSTIIDSIHNEQFGKSSKFDFPNIIIIIMLLIEVI